MNEDVSETPVPGADHLLPAASQGHGEEPDRRRRSVCISGPDALVQVPDAGAVEMCHLPADLGEPGEGVGFDRGLVEGGHLSFLSQYQAFALRLRNRVAELLRRFNPQVDGLVDVGQRLLLRVTVSGASGEFGRGVL